MEEDKEKKSLPANVTKLADRRKKRDPSPKPPKQAELYLALADAINRKPTSLLPRFPVAYTVVETVRGVRQVTVPREDGSLEPVIREAVVNDLLCYCSTSLARMTEYSMTHRQAVEAVATWLSVSAPVTEVPYTRWLREEGHCWRRLPFDLVPNDGPQSLCPTWDGLMEKVTDKDAIRAFVAWVGSLFFKESYRQQYVWIYGPGGDGKGAITRFLHKVFGRGAHFLSNIPREPNQFWTSQLVDRRLIVVPDCDNAKFPSTGLFKTISGDDPITVEPKKFNAFTTVLDSKFIFTSNRLPELSSGSADMRRAIFVEMKGQAAWDPSFEDRLWAEGGAFLWDCITAYSALCPTHGPIPVGENDALKDWVSSVEEAEEVVFEKWFEVDPAKFVVPGDMMRVLDVEWPRRRKPQLNFLEWMRRKYGVYKIRARLDNETRQWRYQGIRLKRSPAGEMSTYRLDDD